MSNNHGYYSFAEDECLVIKTKVPKCSYWNFQLENHWMESLDYRHHKIHLNNFSAELEHEQLVIHVTHSPVSGSHVLLIAHVQAQQKNY